MQRKPEEPINLDTQMAHQRQFLWHILMPVILGALLFIILGVLASTTPGDKPAVWANISTILIVVIVMFSGLGSILVLAGAIFGVDWLTRKIPPVSYLAQIYIQYFGRRIRTLADSSTSPVMETKSTWAAIKPIMDRIRKSLRIQSKETEE